jgi:hypothetical protein
LLKVYSSGVNVSEDVGLKFAAQAARAWDSGHRNGQLSSALLDCDVVEQAKKISWNASALTLSARWNYSSAPP